jgi:hypothetical protein
MAPRVVGVLIAVVLAMPALARAQTVKHPDFTGSWKVTNIEMPEPPAGGGGGGDRGFGGRGGVGGRGGRGLGGGGRRGNGNGGDPASDNGARNDRPQRLEVGQTVRIKQTDERLIVTEEAQGGPVMSSYGLDGKETTNRTGQATTKSKTKWEGVALVTDITRSMETPRGNFDIKSHEIRSLSEDGKTMTVRTTIDTPRGKQTMTVTYELVGG